MDMDEQQSRVTNEIVKLILNSKSSASASTTINPIEVEIQMPVQLHKVYMYEAETQTTSNEISDCLSKEAGDEARLTGSNKYALLSLDEYQIMRTGEEHCLKKYFSDDDLSQSNDEEEIDIAKQMKQITFDENKDRTVGMENFNNNASTVLHTSPSELSNTFLLDDTTHLSATLAQSTSSQISHSRFLPTCKEKSDEKLKIRSSSKSKRKISSIRLFVRQAIDSCRENLSLVNHLLEHIPSTSFNDLEHGKLYQKSNCTLNLSNSIKGLRFYPSSSVQTE
ncbi:unnamed protein product [Adineta ricciae]|uniref:Uncharacterized protein n=1 Tax=Adineta ricciae TaxID=249248 RepID=A0A814M6H7_ADIRI|nr:unnamed protein product [Adineta ricciae]